MYFQLTTSLNVTVNPYYIVHFENEHMFGEWAVKGKEMLHWLDLLEF